MSSFYYMLMEAWQAPHDRKLSAAETLRIICDVIDRACTADEEEMFLEAVRAEREGRPVQLLKWNVTIGTSDLYSETDHVVEGATQEEAVRIAMASQRPYDGISQFVHVGPAEGDDEGEP